MARIITISREFGSGGRELGKRLSEALGIPCYDHQIIEMVAKEYGFDQNYVAHMSENDLRAAYPSTIARGFVAPNYALQQSVQIAAAQHKLIRSLAEKGDCVIVGRCADYVLKDLHNVAHVFLYASEEKRIERIMRVENVDRSAARDLIRKTDKQRKSYYNFFADGNWGLRSNYDLMLRTDDHTPEEVADTIIAFARKG